MSKKIALGFCALTLLLGACGPNALTRAGTGGVTGMVVAGPVGAVAGAAAGGTGMVRVRTP